MTQLEHISEKPWSAYTEADYSIEQWHNACLIHLHSGPPTSKSQCKLPVKTPNGAVNRNGVHAALAALHGARATLQAPADQKTKAENALRRLYSQLGEQFPGSASHSDNVDIFLEHHGVLGQKWGVRRRPKAGTRISADFKRTAHLRGRDVSQLTNKQLKDLTERQNLEQNFRRLNPSTISKGKAALAGGLGTAGMAVTAYNIIKSPIGQLTVKHGMQALSTLGLLVKGLKFVN